MEVVRSSETSVHFYHTNQRHIPENMGFFIGKSVVPLFSSSMQWFVNVYVTSRNEREADSFTYIKRGKSKDDRLVV
jgi:hypothetical protein